MTEATAQRLLRDLRELEARVYDRCPLEDPDAAMWSVLDEVRSIVERFERGESAEEAA